MHVALLSVSTAVLAQTPKGCPPYADGRKPDATPLFNAIDRNKDGKLTRKEWQHAKAPEPSWKMFMGKEKIRKQGYISREDFLAEAPPPGIDMDCDGKITLAEFLATKKWKMGPPPK
jgi:hypothetical protein